MKLTPDHKLITRKLNRTTETGEVVYFEAWIIPVHRNRPPPLKLVITQHCRRFAECEVRPFPSADLSAYTLASWDCYFWTENRDTAIYLAGYVDGVVNAI